jgi:MtfA peptidase
MLGLFSIGVLLIIIVVVANKPFWDFINGEIGVRRPLAKKYKSSIRKHNLFYQKLPDEGKLVFEKKVNQFIYTKDFIPRGISKVTEEMEALIAASAVQLTFGLPDVTFKHFDKILIYPTDYYSAIHRRYHKGEVNPRLKIIVLSWHHFVEGFANEKDGINLGLHEMAHALKFENIIENGEHHFFDLEEYTKWLQMAAIEITNIRNGNDSIFRQYASVNEEEFFAVNMEVYFEQPHQLFDYNPKLYKTISNLLHQDTIKLYAKQSA